MKVKCIYCKSEISSLNKFCPYCKAENKYYSPEEADAVKNKVPKTIDELKQWYNDMNLPDEDTTRFFIGKDYSGPKAFGIFKNDITNEYIVYKNKADGNRSIRYQGTDEAYAVNELFLRLKEEIRNQKSHNHPDSDGDLKKKSKFPAGLILFIVIIAFPLIVAFFTPRDGYYLYNDSYYYHQNSSWYIYNNGWERVSPSKDFKKHYSEYYCSSYYDYDYGISNFENSSYYVDSSSSYDSDDSSWDSSDSWDSGSTDWDSDW